MSTHPQNLPVQPVPSPILCNPYEEPADHWLYDRDTGKATQAGFRRAAAYWYKTEKVGSAQAGLFTDEDQDPLELVNRLREDVRRWRESGYRGATSMTKDLLRHWARESGVARGGFRRLFFCQREAVETLIYLAEIRLPEMQRKAKSRTGFTNFEVTDEHLRRLCAGEDPGFGTRHMEYYPTLLDQPADAAMLGLRRLGCKQATGTGKTVVMAMLICWAFCNRGVNPQSREFPDVVLICCPNLTVKERLQVLKPGDRKNYYDDFGMLPGKYRELLNRGTVIVENWHQFQPQSAHSEGGKSYAVVDKGEEDADSFIRRVLGVGPERLPIMVLNDEGHHCWRPKPGEAAEDGADDEERVAVASGDQKEEAAEARVWLDGLDRINNAGLLGRGSPCVGLCVDLSATPFYIKASGYPEGSPFPWLVSEFGLVDAIESGIVKIPRLPVQDSTGRPDPKYFRLWRDHICADLEPGEKLPGRGGGRPKPEVVYRKAEGALSQIAGQWKERFEYIRDAAPGKDQIPPVLIIVCDNTAVAEEFYRRISGERVADVLTAEDVEEVLGEEDEDEEAAPRKKGKKAKTQVVYGRGEIFADLLSNTAERQYTLRIDSKLLAEAESDDPSKKKSEAAEELRQIVATVGRRGEPGEHIRCVVSVSMLTEGWDASNVTHILGIRAFGSQLLCEQVVGRGLRRMDYTPTVQPDGKLLLSEEFVDVYGIPFSMIPFKGRGSKAAAPEDKPKNHVRTDPDRAHMRMQFPVVEGFVYALNRNIIRCDVDSMEPLDLEPDHEPTATFVRVTAGYAEGAAGAVTSPFPVVLQNREEYYTENHVETIKFELARRVLDRLLSGAEQSEHDRKKAAVLALQSRHQLFPQIFRYVDEYICRKVDYRGCAPGEIGLQQYAKQVVERLATAIEPDEAQGESPLLPVLNKTKPIGSTDDVDFKTVKSTRMTTASHVNQVVLDNQTWEASAGFRIEQAVLQKAARCYVKNQGLGLTIPYEFLGVDHSYIPDFLVRLANGVTLILEIKGLEDNQDKAKHEAAHRWVRAVNRWGRLGRWDFHVNRDPQQLMPELRAIARG
ncbi:MAG: DEAD/DEAH box helicase family protein [Candidatus Eisenbacteria bacterium]|nr:DEAD/DEAH box helicase family protein [Candidatus Eisenbacteria bacterium]